MWNNKLAVIIAVFLLFLWHIDTGRRVGCKFLMMVDNLMSLLIPVGNYEKLLMNLKVQNVSHWSRQH